MATVTRVVWSPSQDISAVREMGDVTMANLQSQPKESSIDPITNDLIIDRFWIETQSANDWLAYVADYNPVSAEILPQ